MYDPRDAIYVPRDAIQDKTKSLPILARRQETQTDLLANADFKTKKKHDVLKAQRRVLTRHQGQIKTIQGHNQTIQGQT